MHNFIILSRLKATEFEQLGPEDCPYLTKLVLKRGRVDTEAGGTIRISLEGEGQGEDWEHRPFTALFKRRVYSVHASLVPPFGIIKNLDTRSVSFLRRWTLPDFYLLRAKEVPRLV